MSHRIFSLSLVLLTVIFICGGYGAQAQSVYQVTDVPVDVTAKDAAVARQQAFNKAQRNAFDILISRMSLSVEDTVNLANLSFTEITTLIQDFEVINEKSSSVRYIATLSFQFKADAVKKLFRQYNIDFVETVSDRTLLLPVFSEGFKEILFEESNVWLNTWKTGLPKFSFLMPILPLGDIEDIESVSFIDNKLQIEGNAYRFLADKYQVSKVILVKLSMIDENSSKVEITTFAKEGLANSEEIMLDLPFSSYQALVNATIAHLDQQWKIEHVINHDSVNSAKFSVTFESSATWYEIRQKINKISLIEKLDLIRIGTHQIDLEIQFNGSNDKFIQAIRNTGLDIKELGISSYLITKP
ncbi:MAG: DUF2066 domain-containing protein [Rhodospirillaceae bacterium]|nr:DUF2066 domain-containing protein [Rhodospirillaceae bacterium]